jgi:hypothetical protein
VGESEIIGILSVGASSGADAKSWPSRTQKRVVSGYSSPHNGHRFMKVSPSGLFDSAIIDELFDADYSLSLFALLADRVVN